MGQGKKNLAQLVLMSAGIGALANSAEPYLSQHSMGMLPSLCALLIGTRYFVNEGKRLKGNYEEFAAVLWMGFYSGVSLSLIKAGAHLAPKLYDILPK